jgi:two-component system, chemotaxis family, chemotaxis protein CheY
MSAILLIDDDASVRQVVSEMLRLAGHDVAIAENGRVALERLGEQTFDLVITDLIMPEQEGIETISEIRRRDRSMPIIAISGGGRLGPGDYLETARYLGADATLAKPFARQELIATVDSLLKR